MEDQGKSDAQARNGCFTVLICTVLTLGGLMGIASSLSELGFSPAAWSDHYRHGMPVLVSALLDLLGAAALGFGQPRRAVVFLGLAVVCRALWSALSPWGWLDTGRGGIEVIGLLLALWLRAKSGPNNSSKPTPLRGAAQLRC